MDLMSSDEDSNEDKYDYISKLDDLYWDEARFHETLNIRTKANNESTAKTKSKPNKNGSSEGPSGATKMRPAVAKHTNTSRMAAIMKTMMESKAVSDQMKKVSKANDFKIPKVAHNNNNSNNNNKRICAEKSSCNQQNAKKLKPNDYNASNYSIENVIKSKRIAHEANFNKKPTSCDEVVLVASRQAPPVQRDPRLQKNLYGQNHATNTLMAPCFQSTSFQSSTCFASGTKPNVSLLAPKNRSQPKDVQKVNDTNLSKRCNNKSNVNSVDAKSLKCSDHILSLILGWKPCWFKEFNDSDNLPPIVPQSALKPLKLFYESYSDYESTYIPLILHETWSQMYDEYWKSKNQSVSKLLSFAISPNYLIKDEFILLCCQAAFPLDSTTDGMQPSEGDLLMMELFVESDRNTEQKLMVFGYISDYSTENISRNTSIFPSLVVPKQPSVLYKYEIRIMNKPIRLSQKNTIQVKSIYYLKPIIRQIEAVMALQYIHLTNDILKPRDVTCQMVVPTTGQSKSQEYNESQYKAIIASGEAVVRPYGIPKIQLIQGPPGTGKTHTLIGIVKHIYMSCEDPKALPKILICAPSNGAVDEIARRLYKERGFLHRGKAQRSLRLVRIGQFSHIHSDVKKISLEELLESNMKKSQEENKTKSEDIIKNIEQKMAKLDQDIANFRAAGNKELWNKAEAEIGKLAKELQRTRSMKRPEPAFQSKHQMRTNIMRNADIVLSTLNSCHQSPIESLYKVNKMNTFQCVIIDEASQCSEPELLMPLIYGMTKMILIGDPMQLPATVISKKASEFKFGRSLFERFFKYFGEYNDTNNRILMLNQQYRMHEHICSFPSKRFYAGKLETNDINVKKVDFPLKPYVVFDIHDTHENSNDPTNKFNELEANFVINVLYAINTSLLCLRNIPSVGVITPYQGQKKLITDRIKSMNLKFVPEINTIDGFQGQEKDVIIISCVRAFENNGNKYSVGFLRSIQRMNVALTRAKHSLIVCISGHSLENDENWKALIEDAKSRLMRFQVPSTLKSDKISKFIAKQIIQEK